MNEKLSYAEMLDIPLTSTVTIKPKRKRKFFGRKKVDVEGIKETLIEKVNDLEENVSPVEGLENPETESRLETDIEVKSDEAEVVMQTSFEEVESETSSVRLRKSKPRKKSRVIGVQLAVIFSLALGIFITNAIMPNSGINVILNQVFGSNATQTDVREYTDFSPEISDNMLDFSLDSGVINVDGEGSLYSPCNGIVSSVNKDDSGKYSITVMHSDKFSTIISGMDYCYVEEDAKVLSKVPVGYVKDGGAKLCFYGADGAVIVNFTITDNAVVWAV